MKETDDDVQRLLRLKRYETPGEEYYHSFIDDFKDRQRSELLSRSSRSILAERVSVWFDELNGAKWLVPAGAAAAAIGVGVFINTGAVDENKEPGPMMAGHGGELNPGVAKKDQGSSDQTEVIEITLPKTSDRVPEFGSGPRGATSSLLPVKGTNWEF